MYEAAHNLLVLADTGIFTYAAGKTVLDYAWFKTLGFLCKHDLLDIPEVQMAFDHLNRYR